MSASQPAVALRPFAPGRDEPLVARWLHELEVARWWGEPGQALAEVRRHEPADSALIVLGARPVGYLCWQVPTRAELAAAGLDDLPAGLVDIDLMIGEADARGRGAGPAALRALCALLAGRGVSRVGLATATANRHSLRACAKAGFDAYRDFVEAGENYRYFTRGLGAG